jgi:hypothetical protein
VKPRVAKEGIYGVVKPRLLLNETGKKTENKKDRAFDERKRIGAATIFIVSN